MSAVIDEAAVGAFDDELAAAREAQGIAGQQDFEGGEVAAPVDEMRVSGTSQLSMFDVGGKRASAASLRLTGGKVLLVDGQAFKKGDVITGTFTAVVNEVGQKDSHDPKTGIVVSAEQKHGARITDLTVEGAQG